MLLWEENQWEITNLQLLDTRLLLLLTPLNTNPARGVQVGLHTYNNSTSEQLYHFFCVYTGVLTIAYLFCCLGSVCSSSLLLAPRSQLSPTILPLTSCSAVPTLPYPRKRDLISYWSLPPPPPRIPLSFPGWLVHTSVRQVSNNNNNNNKRERKKHSSASICNCNNSPCPTPNYHKSPSSLLQKKKKKKRQ